MAPRYKKQNPDPQPILTRKRSTDLADLDRSDCVAIAGCVIAAVMHGNAVYVAPGRFGTVTLKFYVEGDQFAESLSPGDDWGQLGEEITEALYDLATVAKMRGMFAATPREPASAARKTPREGSDTGGGGNAP